MHPEVPALHVDVMGIVHENQRACSISIHVQGQVLNLYVVRADPRELALALIRDRTMIGCKGRAGKTQSQTGGDRQRSVVLVVDSDAGQVLPISKPLYDALKGFGRSLFQQRFNAFLEAFRQDLGPLLQVQLQRALFTSELEVREKK